MGALDVSDAKKDVDDDIGCAAILEYEGEETDAIGADEMSSTVE